MRICSLTTAATVATSLAWAAAAGATTYYVSPSGNASNAGTQAAPWTLAKANTSLVAGDVAILAPGNYGTSIAPSNSGSSYSRFIAYVGSLSNPASTVVSGISLGSRSYVSIKGVQFGGGLNITTSRDSIGWCIAPSGMVNFNLGGNDCVITNTTMTGSNLELIGGANGANPTFVSRDSLINSTFNASNSGSTPVLKVAVTSELYFKSCRLILRNKSSGQGGMMKFYGGRSGKFIDCVFDLQNQRSLNGCDECSISGFRDYTMNNLFQRDTFDFHGPLGLDFMLSGSGTFPGTVHGNKFESCLFRQDAPSAVAMLYWQNGARSDTLLGCTFMSKGVTPIVFSGLASNCLVKNNTFIRVGGGGYAAQGSGDWGNWSATSVVNNIFYSTPGSGSGQSGSALLVGSDVASSWDGSNNLFFCKNPSSSSIYIDGTGTGPGSSGRMCSSYASECSSKYGDPLFVGSSSTDVFNYDAHLKAGSPAIGAGVGGVDIGGNPFGSGGGGDTTPPSRITNLATSSVSDVRVTLTWTAPGDDGAIGRASAYELRQSSQPITDANFASATPVTISQAPQTAGATEQFTVNGLTPGTLYYFAVRAIDDASNAGLVSNNVSPTTVAVDTIPPATIQDLTAQP